MKQIGAFLFILGVFLFVVHSEAAKINITGTVRDFWPCVNTKYCGKFITPQVTCGSCHNDFERYNGDDRKMVQTILGPDRKPIYNDATSHPSISNKSYSFDQWFRDVPGVNIPIAITLTLDSEVCDGKCVDGVYGYSNTNFFPINNQGWGNYYYGSNNINFAFTFEVHTTFTYTGKEVFNFFGDDDVWVFINNTLVVDLGGVHGMQSASVNLQTLSNPKLKINETYNFDIFFAERHTSASNFKMFTSLAMTCPWYDWCGVCQGDGQTCCKCNDNRTCTVDTCNVNNGSCIFTPISCSNNGSPCYTSSCNEANGKCFNTTAVVCPPPSQCKFNGTCQVNNGSCYYPNRADGTQCDDGDACTQSDSCIAGVCIGSNRVVCSAASECKQDPICNGTTGTCMFPNKPDTTTCNDGDPCTLEDACSNGLCVGKPKACPATGQCYVDGTCDSKTGSCVNPTAKNGLACNDNLICTLNDTCSSGVCSGAAKVCNTPPNQCYTGGYCSSNNGSCIYTPLNGTSCNDMNACTTLDICISGVCTGFSPVTCPGPSDSCHNQGTCDTNTGICSNPAKPNGVTCTTADKCALYPTCNNGMCTGNSTVKCADPTQCQNPGVCVSSTGQCTFSAITDGSTCNDGNACTQIDSCRSGTCVGSNPVVCTKKDQCHTLGSCDTLTGLCSNPSVVDGTGCMNKDNCSHSSTCIGGVCTANYTTNCNQPPQCYGPGTCDGASGFCNYPKLNGTLCNDQNACTQVDMCIQGTCVGFNSVSCPAIDQCHSEGKCNTKTGTCTTPSLADGTSCNDGNACTALDQCTNGVCTGYSDKVCPPSSNQCQGSGVCNKATGVCSYPFLEPGTGCDDNDACTATSSCSSATGTCFGSNHTICPPPTQCKIAGICDSKTGICNYENKPIGTPCNDGNACTQVDQCDMNGQCAGSTPVVCPTADQCHDATTCNVDTGKCDPIPVSGRSCNDNNACTQTDTCSNGVCIGSNQVTCPQPSDDCHTVGTCNPTTGVCSNPTLPEFSLCDDTNLCSRSSYCLTGVCTGANWTVCGAPSQCQLPGTCDPSLGSCIFPNQEDGFSCNDRDPCTTNDVCINGQCVGGAQVSCPSLGQCFDEGTCDSVTGSCIPRPKQDGTNCTDGNKCTLEDVCITGVCTSRSSVVCELPEACHMAGICVPEDGSCYYPKSPNGTGCISGDSCATVSACVDGLCVEQETVSCAPLDQCHLNGTCDSGTGECSYPEAPFSTPCDDSNLCTWNDACYLGSCKGLPILCNSPPQCRIEGSCNLTNGECNYPNAPDGITCDDGNSCTLTDQCMNGYCVGSNPVVCAALDDCHDVGTCNDYTGLCDNPIKEVGSVCNDHNACSGASSCNNLGFCVGSDFKICESISQCHDSGVCNILTGECSNPIKPSNTSCHDMNACTEQDLCTPNGECIGTSITCPAPDQCHGEGVCNNVTGICSYPNLSDGTTCNDQNLCTLSDTCQAGICVGTNLKQCTASDSCHIEGECNPIDGTCTNPIAADGLLCDDNNKCSNTDVCLSGKCTGFNMVVCSAQDQCHSEGVCDTNTGICSNPEKANGNACNDNNLCTNDDACYNGICQGSDVVCPNATVCHRQGRCNRLTGLCSNPLLDDGTICDDNNSCSGRSSCAAGLCIGDSFKVCPAIDQCHGVGSCDPSSTSGDCVPNPLTGAQYTCDDGNQCTQNDQCTAGVCVGTTISNCVPGLPPYILLTDVTQSIVPTQTLWLPLYFHGYVNLPKFQVRVTNLPISDSHDYVFGYVQYPWDGTYTELYNDAQLSANETDYVALKLSPPQNQLVEVIVLQVEVQYEWNGENRIGNHIVTVPVIPSLGDFSVVSLTAPIGVVVAGQSIWFPVSVLALSRLLDFRITFQSDVLEFTYPENTKNYSSFYADSFINVGEVDFVAVRVVAPVGAEGTTTALMNVSWKGTEYQNQTIAVTFEVIPPIEKRHESESELDQIESRDSSAAVSISNFDVVCPESKEVYILFEVTAGSVALTDVSVALEPVDGITITYATESDSSVSLGSLGATKSQLVGIQISASKAGTYTTSVTVTYTKSGISSSLNTQITITSKANTFQILINSLKLNAGETSIQSIPFQANDMLTSNVRFDVVSKPAGVNVKQIVTSTNRKDSYFLLANTSIDTNLASGNYPFIVKFQYTTDNSNGDLQEQLVTMVLAVNNANSKPPVTTLTGTDGNSGGNGDNSKNSGSGLYIGIGVGAGIAFVALVAVAAVIVKKRRTRKVFVFAEPQLQQFSK